MGLFDRLTRKRQDAAPKRTTRRGKGPGRTRQTRVDDLEQVRDKRRPQGVTSPIKDATKATVPPTTSSVAAPERTPTKTTNDQSSPASGLANVTGTEQGKTNGVRRNVGSGREKKANVTREQLQKTGLSLRDYLNFMDKNDRRPRSKADSEAAKKLTAGFKAKKAKKMMGGGMMKSKMKAKGMKAGGKMKPKGYSAGGPLKKAPEGNTGLKKLPKQVRNKMGFMAGGGMMKTKGMKAGGKMKAKGGATGGKKQKVRGAGIERKGLRKAKMR
tara:strand:- start:703 stop:1515 length:813 start_codon:yes stop_codon:yes gene_type:complete